MGNPNAEPGTSMPDFVVPKTPRRRPAHSCPPPLLPKSDTPARARTVHSHTHRRDSLETKRQKTVKELGYAIEISFEKFRDLCLPRLPDDFDADTVDTVCSVMEREHCWHSFEDAISKGKKTENFTFAHLEALFERVVAEAKEVNARKATQTFRFDVSPHKTPTTAERASTFKNDAHFMVKSAPSGTLSLYDTGVPAEFKLDDQPAKRDDVSPLLQQTTVSFML